MKLICCFIVLCCLNFSFRAQEWIQIDYQYKAPSITQNMSLKYRSLNDTMYLSSSFFADSIESMAYFGRTKTLISKSGLKHPVKTDCSFFWDNLILSENCETIFVYAKPKPSKVRGLKCTKNFHFIMANQFLSYKGTITMYEQIPMEMSVYLESGEKIELICTKVTKLAP